MKRMFSVGPIGCLVAAAAAWSADGQAPWTTYQGNPCHTGHVPVSLDVDGLKLRWQQTFDPPQGLNPVVAADGRVFVTQAVYFSAGTELHALDTETGQSLWTVDLPAVYSINPPAYAYGNVYLQTGKGTGGPPPLLRAYDAASGDFVFQTQFSAQWESYYAPTIYGGKVYANGGYYGGMYAFDAFTGAQEWFQPLNQYDDWTPAVDEDYAYAYVGEYSPGLYVLDRRTGEVAYSIADPNFDWDGWSMHLAPVLGGKGDVLVIHDGRLVSFDLEAASIGWELNGSFTGQVSVADGVIYAISSGALTARDQSTGAMLWGWAAQEALTETMIITNSHAIVRTSDATFLVDLKTHDDVFTIPSAGHLAYSEGSLYIASPTGVLSAYDLPGFAFADCNGNGLADSQDILAGTSADCNGNSLPDECDVDSGESGDTNLNGVPDECDLVNGDANLDGLVNAQDLAIVLATWGDCPDLGLCFGDTNGDGVVDVVDLVAILVNWSF